MKTITITYPQIKKEFIVLLVLLTISFLMNVYAIVTYNGAWIELMTQLHVVLVLSVVFYLIAALVRSIVYLSRSMFKNRLFKTMKN